jgi:hypothetical protein
LLDAAFNIAAALFYVPHETSGEAEISVCFGKDFEIQKIEHPWIMESENAFQNEDVRGVDSCGLFQACVLLERVDRHLSDLAILDIP